MAAGLSWFVVEAIPAKKFFLSRSDFWAAAEQRQAKKYRDTQRDVCHKVNDGTT